MTFNIRLSRSELSRALVASAMALTAGCALSPSTERHFGVRGPGNIENIQKGLDLANQQSSAALRVEKLAALEKYDEAICKIASTDVSAQPQCAAALRQFAWQYNGKAVSDKPLWGLEGDIVQLFIAENKAAYCMIQDGYPYCADEPLDVANQSQNVQVAGDGKHDPASVVHQAAKIKTIAPATSFVARNDDYQATSPWKQQGVDAHNSAAQMLLMPKSGGSANDNGLSFGALFAAQQGYSARDYVDRLFASAPKGVGATGAIVEKAGAPEISGNTVAGAGWFPLAAALLGGVSLAAILASRKRARQERKVVVGQDNTAEPNFVLVGGIKKKAAKLAKKVASEERATRKAAEAEEKRKNAGRYANLGGAQPVEDPSVASLFSGGVDEHVFTRPENGKNGKSSCYANLGAEEKAPEAGAAAETYWWNTEKCGLFGEQAGASAFVTKGKAAARSIGSQFRAAAAKVADWAERHSKVTELSLGVGAGLLVKFTAAAAVVTLSPVAAAVVLGGLMAGVSGAATYSWRTRDQKWKDKGVSGVLKAVAKGAGLGALGGGVVAELLSVDFSNLFSHTSTAVDATSTATSGVAPAATTPVGDTLASAATAVPTDLKSLLPETELDKLPEHIRHLASATDARGKLQFIAQAVEYMSHHSAGCHTQALLDHGMELAKEMKNSGYWTERLTGDQTWIRHILKGAVGAKFSCG